MSLLVLSATDVDTVASTLSPDDLQLLMAQVFIRLSDSSAREGSVVMPPRISIPTAHHTALFMPARLGLHLQEGQPSHDTESEATYLGDTAIKVVCVPRQNDSRGLPATTLILDEETGVTKAIVNARKLTALRNAAGSLLSTSLVGPSKPQTLVAFGAGQQIESHLDLHIRHFPSITQCIVVNRTANHRAISLQEKLISRFSHIQISLLASNASNISTSDQEIHNNESSSIQSAVKSADIIICATSSTTPLFPSSWVKNGTHIILIGSYTPPMREVDKSLVQRAIGSFKSWDGENSASYFPVLLVDSREACLHEAGELIDAGVSPEQMTELGQLIPMDENGNLALESFCQLLDTEKPRVSEDLYDGPITMFKSVGIGLQDVAIASAIVEKSFLLGKKIGTIITDYDPNDAFTKI